MRKISILLIAGISAVWMSCSSNTATAPYEAPYLVFQSSPTIVFDSTGHVVRGDTPIVVSMSDHSNFRLKQGTSTGYSQAFSWQVDDTTDAATHVVTITARPSAITRVQNDDGGYPAYFYPMVLNSKQFVSTLPFIAVIDFSL